MKSIWLAAFCIAAATPAFAGPPFLTDDPDPTPYQHYEIYLFANGGSVHGDLSGDTGLDFNYGGGPDLQLSATFPISYDRPSGAHLTTGLGNIELAAKVRVAHQETSGVNVAAFPRVFLPAGSNLGDDRAAFLLPVWVGRNGEDWSVFGGGGCALHRGGDARDFCIAGVATTHRFHNLQLGAELFHQTPDARDAIASTIAGFGASYDLSEHLHVLSYVGAQLDNVSENGRGVGYASILFTF